MTDPDFVITSGDWDLEKCILELRTLAERHQDADSDPYVGAVCNEVIAYLESLR